MNKKLILLSLFFHILSTNAASIGESGLQQRLRENPELMDTQNSVKLTEFPEKYIKAIEAAKGLKFTELIENPKGSKSY
ncbi:hypothetical protein [Candidatus Nesciobacter abundans]|uniref:Uncharacterized protein n=1 Tax=Candidatus Nesciobacter abundans TaxID=2601668 RepID=A0A5C0UG73_9PROT|nr:hypothetical protein [Candidatus Nesciobacter abundans]QEK39106.1 hypothetical protein FZC36_01485 [Candidatus Nesciobacter abundans]